MYPQILTSCAEKKEKPKEAIIRNVIAKNAPSPIPPRGSTPALTSKKAAPKKKIEYVSFVWAPQVSTDSSVGTWQIIRRARRTIPRLTLTSRNIVTVIKSHSERWLLVIMKL